MFAFRLGPDQPAYDDDFQGWLNACVRLMNAHLACLHAAMGFPPILPSAVVTTWTSMQVDFESGSFAAMTDARTGGTVLALYDARRTFQVGVWDWRFERGGSLIAIPREELRRSFGLLEDLLARPSKDGVLLRAEMLLRAKVALIDEDPSGALTNAWTAIEGILGDLFCRYLNSEEGRPIPGGSGKFINRRRRDFLEGSQMTVRHVTEVLSLLDILSFPLYGAVLKCAKARNNWLHTETVPPVEIANLAIAACGELFEQAEGVPLHLVPAS